MDEKNFAAIQRFAPGLYRLCQYDPAALQLMYSALVMTQVQQQKARYIQVWHLPWQWVMAEEVLP